MREANKEIPAARKNFKPKSTPEQMCNKSYLIGASDGLAKKQFQPAQDHAMKWSGATRLEIELLLVEVHTEISNVINQ